MWNPSCLLASLYFTSAAVWQLFLVHTGGWNHDVSTAADKSKNITV